MSVKLIFQEPFVVAQFIARRSRDDGNELPPMVKTTG